MADKTLFVKIKSIFSPAQSRANITSGENLETSLGKISKWFSDIGSAAFKDVPSSGNAGNSEVVLGNDSRLSDDRTPTAHNQPSSTITSMTGYSKPQSTSAIAASDTLNEAIGKLEKGLDGAGGGGDLDAHIATNVEDDGGVHGIRCYNGKLEVYNDYSQEWCDPSEIGIAVGNVSNLTIGQGNLSLTLNWSDPANTADATWKGTKVVMKVGSYPESVTDGQLVCDNQVRDNYSTTELKVNNLTEGTTYYFQLFPYTTTGTITVDDGNRISGVAEQIYELGLRVAFRNKTFTRLGEAVGLSGGSDFDDFPMYQRRRCNLANDGTVNAYLGDANYAVDGSNGQVMVEQPKFYYKVVPVYQTGSRLDTAEYWVSNKPLQGYKLHPAFKNTSGNEIDYFYEAAYEGYVSNNTLSSISDVFPSAGYDYYTRAKFRTYAAARGSGWRQETIWSLSADQILMIIEYGTFNMQAAIGKGNSYSNSNTYLKTGTLNSYGNGTYGTTANTTTAVQWRGKENPWGNKATWVEGVNIFSYGVYIANSYTFADNTSTNYTVTSISLPSSETNYISAFGYDSNFDWAFIPCEANSSYGNSTSPVGDLMGYNSSYSSIWKILMSSGACNSNNEPLKDGPFYFACWYGYTDSYPWIGARLLYVG